MLPVLGGFGMGDFHQVVIAMLQIALLESDAEGGDRGTIDSLPTVEAMLHKTPLMNDILWSGKCRCCRYTQQEGVELHGG
jgi:hypothetical protein